MEHCNINNKHILLKQIRAVGNSFKTISSFYVLFIVHLGTIRVNNQLDALF